MKNFSKQTVLKKVDKGHFMVRKIDELVKAKPHIIVMTGNVFAVQKALSGAMRRNPALADVPAIKIWLSITCPFMQIQA